MIISGKKSKGYMDYGCSSKKIERSLLFNQETESYYIQVSKFKLFMSFFQRESFTTHVVRSVSLFNELVQEPDH